MKAFWLLLVVGLSLRMVSSFCPDRCLCLLYKDHSISNNSTDSYQLSVNCSGSEKTEVPYGIDPKVNVLDLSYNEIRSYNHSKYLRVVKEIDLSNNKISEVSFGSSFECCRSIDLSSNYIEDLRKIDVKKLSQLEKLNISYNSRLQSLAGLKSDSLQNLDLSHCSVSLSGKEVLEHLPNIESLDVSYNSFSSLNDIRSDSLESLDASHGSLKNLTQFEIYNLRNLKKLNVSFNPKLKIDFSYENSCWDVEELDLSDSDIDSLEEMFPFCSLKTLNASLNNIKVIEVRTFFNNCELSFVNLSNNHISKIHSRSFFTTNKLKILDLSSNQIQNLDFSIHLRQVTDLYLSRNQISNLTGLVLKNVVNLNLAHNKIKDISINLNEHAPTLKTLNLSFNKIKTVNRINSKSVTEVDLSHSKITFIEVNAFEGADSLVELNLAGNKLTTLDFRIFKNVESLKNLLLLGNQWACNCQSHEFKEFYEFLAVDRPLTNVNELSCVKSNKTWMNTCFDTWQRENEWKKTVYSLTVSLAIALIVVAVIFFCKYFNDKKQTREEENTTRLRREAAERRFSSYDNSITSINLTGEQDEFPQRSSTPPPNYEAALLLPKLTEEQRSLAISTLSIASPQPASEEQTRETDE